MAKKSIPKTKLEHYNLYASAISSDEVASILRFHLVAEYFLEQMILVALPRGDKIVDSGNYSFAQKLGIVDATQLYPDNIVSSLRNLNKIRNKCSHELNHALSPRDIESIGSPLGKRWTAIKRDDRKDAAPTISQLFSELTANMSDLLENAELQCRGVSRSDT